MEVPAVKFAAYCLDKHTTAVKRIDELGHAVEAPAKAGNICDQNTIEGAGHPLFRPIFLCAKTCILRVGSTSYLVEDYDSVARSG